MHFLDRMAAPVPEGLSNYDYSVDPWDKNHPNFQHRAKIKSCLESMQGKRCAHCECDLDKNGQHIEHFRQRGRFPEGTFDWNNMFWSCERKDSCGKHKDSCGSYDYTQLIKPDVEDPEHFFIFSTNGSIGIRSGLTPAERHRAQETLRIFNIDAERGPHRQMRRIAVIGYLNTLEELQQLSSLCNAREINDYIDREFSYTRSLPFCTAIKHALTLQE